MISRNRSGRAWPLVWFLPLLLLALVLVACGAPYPKLVPDQSDPTGPIYIIGTGDSLSVEVWRNSDLSADAVVRPDGRLSVPLIGEVMAEGKTPTKLAEEIQEEMKAYVREPRVTVSITQAIGNLDQQVRVVGEAVSPQAIPYRARLSLLDVMIIVGGLGENASGNRGVLVRQLDGRAEEYRLRIGDLIHRGDITANIPLAPGDIIIIPQSAF